MKRSIAAYFSKGEWLLWGGSVCGILLAFLAFDRESWMTLAASLIGVTSLIFNAKGNPAGQALIILFSLLYGAISYSFAYYGEMITYLGMSAPMAVFALISWLRHPYQGHRSQVQVNQITRNEVLCMLLLTGAVTLLFYFILRYFHTANLLPSTISVTTSFLTVYLTFRRSPWFALAYGANDAVLIVLWTLAARQDPSYLSVVVCFVMFLVNDLYGFYSWCRMAKRQAEATPDAA